MTQFLSRSSRLLGAATLLTAVGAAGSASAAVVSVPYSNDFTAGEDFTESPASVWSLDTSAGTYTYTSEFSTGRATLTADGLGGTVDPSDFTATTSFSVSDSSDNSNADTNGLLLLGEDEDPGEYILVDFSSRSLLRIINIGGPGNGSLVNTSQNTSGDGVTFAENQSFTLSVDGTYDAVGNLSLSASVTDGVNTSTLTASDLVLGGNYDGAGFGLRSRFGAGGGEVTAAYDSFSVVPEPASFALLGLGGFCLMTRRRG